MILFQIASFLILLFGFINLVRMTIYLIGADIYTLRMSMRKRSYSNYRPKISVVIPAHNEEKNIIHAISSVLHNNYPSSKLQVIVVDDGSTDRTILKVMLYKQKHSTKNLFVVSLKEALGKSHALNIGMKQYATGELVMCLDADSYLGRNALRRAVLYFTNPQTMALASNVKIIPKRTFLNIVQVFEYVISYQMKRAQSQFNVEYIIGGIGSMFRRSYLKKIGFYDTNTVTEDIDLTMKILQAGNKNVRVVYGADVMTYTQGVLTVDDLIKQRYRWKWGRYQTFLKNRRMFFTEDDSFTKALTWVYLPFALWCDFAFFFEPFLVSFILLTAILFRDPSALISAFIVMSFYMSMNILSEDTLTYRTKIRMLVGVPFMYAFFYVLSFVEYVALIKSWKNMPGLKNSLNTKYNTWKPVKRLEFA